MGSITVEAAIARELQIVNLTSCSWLNATRRWQCCHANASAAPMDICLAIAKTRISASASLLHRHSRTLRLLQPWALSQGTLRTMTVCISCHHVRRPC